MSADADSFNFFISFGGIIISTVIIILSIVMSFFFSMLEDSVKSSGDLSVKCVGNDIFMSVICALY